VPLAISSEKIPQKIPQRRSAAGLLSENKVLTKKLETGRFTVHILLRT